MKEYKHHLHIGIDLLFQSGKWQLAGISTIPEFSAAANFFGQTLQEILGVPVGLIVTSWGASKAEAWMDENSLSAFKEVPIPDEGKIKIAFNFADDVLSSLQKPLKGFQIAGIDRVFVEAEVLINRDM